VKTGRQDTFATYSSEAEPEGFPPGGCRWRAGKGILDRLLSLLLADPLVRCEGCGEHVHPEELEAGHECYDGAHA
jgi:hypothetical protein